MFTPTCGILADPPFSCLLSQHPSALHSPASGNLRYSSLARLRVQGRRKGLPVWNMNGACRLLKYPVSAEQDSQEHPCLQSTPWSESRRRVKKPEEARLTLEGGAGRNWLCAPGHVVTRHSLTYHHRPLLLAARAAGRAASTSTSAAATQRGSGTQRPMACPARPGLPGAAGGGGGGPRRWGWTRRWRRWRARVPSLGLQPQGRAVGSGQPGSGSQLVG